MAHVRKTSALSGLLAIGLAAAAATTGTASPAAAALPSRAEAATQAAGHVVVQGDILARYLALGGEGGPLGAPLTNELTTPNGIGRFSVFAHGSIYWTAALGAHEVYRSVMDDWGRLGYENSFAGFPTTGPASVPGGTVQHFQGTTIYWSPVIGAREVHGDIAKTYCSTYDCQNGKLGFPVTDETKTSPRAGAYNVFQEGSIYWQPGEDRGVEIGGQIEAEWGRLGFENSTLGFPTQDERDATLVPGARASYFERGGITWTAQKGAWISDLSDVASSADANARTVTFDSVHESFSYDANDRFYRYTDPDIASIQPTSISLSAFKAELKKGTRLQMEAYTGQAGTVTEWAINDIPQSAGIQPSMSAHR